MLISSFIQPFTLLLGRPRNPVHVCADQGAIHVSLGLTPEAAHHLQICSPCYCESTALSCCTRLVWRHFLLLTALSIEHDCHGWEEPFAGNLQSWCFS